MNESWMLIVILGIAALYTYFVPVMVAASKRHPRTAAIFVLTLFLGWSLIGWVLALVWALSPPLVAAGANPVVTGNQVSNPEKTADIDEKDLIRKENREMLVMIIVALVLSVIGYLMLS